MVFPLVSLHFLATLMMPGGPPGHGPGGGPPEGPPVGFPGNPPEAQPGDWYSSAIKSCFSVLSYWSGMYFASASHSLIFWTILFYGCASICLDGLISHMRASVNLLSNRQENSAHHLHPNLYLCLIDSLIQQRLQLAASKTPHSRGKESMMRSAESMEGHVKSGSGTEGRIRESVRLFNELFGNVENFLSVQFFWFLVVHTIRVIEAFGSLLTERSWSMPTLGKCLAVLLSSLLLTISLKNISLCAKKVGLSGDGERNSSDNFPRQPPHR